jgi:4-hydroxy-tetrahydrodipicolinate synthase
MVTPFRPDGALDTAGAAELAKWLVDHRSDALVIGGSTGEGAVIADSELRELVTAVRGSVSVPVIVATGTADTRHTITRTQIAKEAGADAVLVVTPYYARPSQTGIYAHFEAVAAASEVPVVAYDVPVRAGRRIATETMLRMARELPGIVGVKDAAGDVVSTARLVANAPSGFDVYCGDDLFTLPMLAVGAVGIVSVASHWLGPQISEMVARFAKGDSVGAQELNARYLEEVAFQGSEEYPNPLPAKAILRALGLPAGQCRLPMGEAPADLDARARKLIASLSA